MRLGLAWLRGISPIDPFRSIEQFTCSILVSQVEITQRYHLITQLVADVEFAQRYAIAQLPQRPEQELAQ